MSKKTKVCFDDYFSDIYGESWESLKNSLNLEKKYIELKNLSQPYFIDEASGYPPQLLEVKRGETVLDMCAAPGGKALQLAVALAGTGTLQLNELSRARRERLQKVLRDHLPEKWRENIKVTGLNSEKLGLIQKGELFDKILLDAPCSSEKHVMANEKEFQKWSPARTKNLSHRQMAMLCAALSILKPDGELVYSTCSISPKENHELIQSFLKKRKGLVASIPIEIDMGEQVEEGVLVRPDKDEGAGPMYICKMKKVG